MLIALKLAAGAITGSVAILTEAMHSSIDLIASFVAYFSVREADKPADAEHPYGHAKIENLAAAIEAMLILVGSGVIIYAAARSLANGPEVHSLGIGIARHRVLDRRQPRRVDEDRPPRARHRVAGAGGRRRAPAHRRRDLGRGPGRARRRADHGRGVA